MNFEEKFKSLYKIMTNQDLEWICQQVDDEIKNGKTHIEKKGKIQKFVKMIEYKPQEKYVLLLEAYKRGFLDPLNMIEGIKKTHLSNIGLRKIKFVDEYSQENTIVISHADKDGGINISENINIKEAIMKINKEIISLSKTTEKEKN